MIFHIIRNYSECYLLTCWLLTALTIKLTAPVSQADGIFTGNVFSIFAAGNEKTLALKLRFFNLLIVNKTLNS